MTEKVANCNAIGEKMSLFDAIVSLAGHSKIRQTEEPRATEHDHRPYEKS
jgi:hypothetical protein